MLIKPRRCTRGRGVRVNRPPGPPRARECKMDAVYRKAGTTKVTMIMPAFFDFNSVILK